MGDSYRIRTELGINQNINLLLEQDFEFLEILSLKIQQTEIYPRSCAEYGVVVGRVTANNGFGLPNARVSVFIPIEAVDESNPLITSIYPYKSPEDKNEDGFRYNLLPYEKSYSTHAATGTLPSRLDALTNPIVVEIYDKYYKFTAKTNDSGDYMIMGVPTGTRKLVMDVDLSDIGEFSLTPNDLVRMGLATESQVAGNRFRTSNDLNSLPQIITLQKDIDVLPLWGDPDLCQLAICRTDFDLRDEANVDIQPTSVFMGSIYSSPNKYRVRPGFKIFGGTVGGCKPKDNLGNLCGLTPGPGQILAIRQTVAQDSDGNPVLEQFQLEQAGNIIDGDGTWLTELPMNLDYVITNEFGDKVISSDPAIGIPTKGKYRFKIKWQQPPTLTEQTRRAYFLVPNVKEYGWNAGVDPNTNTNPSQLVTEKKQLGSSYYFGLAWSGYTDGFTGQRQLDKLNEAIDCNDTFYQFDFNRVYTVSGLIDQWKKGDRGRFIGIKEIDNDDCAGSVNKFPVNDGFRSFDFLFFMMSILLSLMTPTLMFLIISLHPVFFVLNIVINILCLIGRIPGFRWIRRILPCRKEKFKMAIPMVTYPECQACDCKQERSTAANDIQSIDGNAAGFLTYLSFPETYTSKFENIFSANTDPATEAIINAEAVAGVSSLSVISNPRAYKMPLSRNVTLDGRAYHISSKSLPLGERINVFNSRKNYFTGKNKIRVKVEPDLNIGPSKVHYDNTITVLSNTQYNAGDLLSMVSPGKTQDVNWLYTANTFNGVSQGVSGMSLTTTAATAVTITYATTPTNPQTVTYSLPYGRDITYNEYPADIEYFQVITAITWNDIITKWNPNTLESFPDVLSATTILDVWQRGFHPSLPLVVYNCIDNNSVRPIDFIEDIQSQYILVLQRGVDPYSPKYKQEYSLGNIFGTNESDPNFTFTAETRLNIPIQTDSSATISVQDYTQSQMFYPSYFFKPGVDGSSQVGSTFSAYTTVNTGYYGLQSGPVDFNQFYFNFTSKQIITETANGFYLSAQNAAKYDLSEDLTGGSGMACKRYANLRNISFHDLNSYEIFYFGYNYYSRTIYEGVSWSAMTINNRVRNVMRTDRLPSSDGLDGGSWNNNPSLLQQNLNFNIYIVDEGGTSTTSPGFTTGASTVEPDLVGLPDSTRVLESFNCEKMVSLQCYEGFGSQFQIKANCEAKDNVEKGCYLFFRRPLIDIFKDIGTLSEWTYRFRFFFGLCRGVLSQSFSNNWVNGSLYMFPIQVDTTYNRLNQPVSKHCTDLIYFDTKTTNFYYRSSPYNDISNKFIGKPATDPGSVNTRNLLFPTTVMNLGMKDSFYGEISFEPSTRAYVMTELDSTTFGDTSDLISLFVISRITDEGFFRRLLTIGKDNGLNQLFNRPGTKIDGDLAQLLSINSELGLIKFSPEYYEISQPSNNPTSILGTSNDPVVAVWYSSTTQNLQTKDYLTPGRINFRATPTSNYAPFNYGVKTQDVPFYKWQLDGGTTIFGTQKNNWITGSNDIVKKGYQTLDRANINQPGYFQSSVTPNTNDLNLRGYIFSVDANGNYSQTAALYRSFILSAPFHFYFGVSQGKTALDKFKTKFSIVE